MNRIKCFTVEEAPFKEGYDDLFTVSDWEDWFEVGVVEFLREKMSHRNVEPFSIYVVAETENTEVDENEDEDWDNVLRIYFFPTYIYEDGRADWMVALPKDTSNEYGLFHYIKPTISENQALNFILGTAKGILTLHHTRFFNGREY